MKRKFLILDATIPSNGILGSDISYTWKTSENKLSAYYALIDGIEGEKVKEYIFDVLKSKKLDDFSSLDKDEKIIVVGEEVIELLEDVHYMRRWREFDNIDEAISFMETLSSHCPIYIFSSKDDIQDDIINEYEKSITNN